MSYKFNKIRMYKMKTIPSNLDLVKYFRRIKFTKESRPRTPWIPVTIF